MGVRTDRRARAFAPGHVTGAFLPQTDARDPRGRGSVGVGLVLDAGVYADAAWSAADRPRLSVTGDGRLPLHISTEVARRLLALRPGRLSVRLRHELPIGQGFGTSAAGALATALAVGRLVGASRQHAVETAHLADLFGGGGLGGVAAILGGGLEIRRRPGIPPFGAIARQPYASPLLVAVVGPPMASPPLLSSPRLLARVAAAYRNVGELSADVSPGRFWAASEEFTDRLGLAPPEVRRAVRAVRRRGGRAAQAMFGRSFFASLPAGPRRQAILTWLERRGIRALEVRAGRRGATLRPVPPA
ncbi:MAG: hypothetical protein ACLP78_07350 [Thermoplasmata archaeon]